MLHEVKVPVLAESVSEAGLLGWEKQTGDFVKTGDKLVDVETDKVILEITAQVDGYLVEILKPAGSIVLAEEVIARMDTEAAPAAGAGSDAETPVESAPLAEAGTPKTSPAVRKLVEEQGIDLTQVPHHGDRVTKADVLTVITPPTPEVPPPEADFSSPDNAALPVVEEKAFVASTPVPPPHQETQPLPGRPPERPEQRVPMSRLRRRAAERLLNAQHQHAILTTFNEIDMHAVKALRVKYKNEFEKTHGARLGFMSFFTRAVVAALKQFPIINASIDGDDIIYHGYYDIGIAVNSPRGLVVPVLHDADSLSFAEIEKGIADFARRAGDNQLTLDDLNGGTFSITNGGIFGSMLSTPILNPPQSAILGMHNIVDRPLAENGQVVIRPVMYVALSYDHRIIDGRDAVRFLYTVKQQIEDPLRLLLEV